MICETCHGDGWQRAGDVTITVQVCAHCYGQLRCPRCGETPTIDRHQVKHECACGWDSEMGWWNAAMRKESDD